MIKLSLYLASLLLGTNFSTSSTPVETKVPASIGAGVSVTAPSLTSAEQRFIDLTNAERSSRGIGTLTTNATLVQAARLHSREMWEKDYFDHVSPTPELQTPMKRYLTALGHTPKWAYLGENLFYCSVVDVERGHRCLMQSPKHRENLLNERFEQIGVGVFTSPDGRFWVTELFLAQRD